MVMERRKKVMRTNARRRDQRSEKGEVASLAVEGRRGGGGWGGGGLEVISKPKAIEEDKDDGLRDGGHSGGGEEEEVDEDENGDEGEGGEEGSEKGEVAGLAVDWRRGTIEVGEMGRLEVVAEPEAVEGDEDDGWGTEEETVVAGRRRKEMRMRMVMKARAKRRDRRGEKGEVTVWRLRGEGEVGDLRWLSNRKPSKEMRMMFGDGGGYGGGREEEEVDEDEMMMREEGSRRKRLRVWRLRGEGGLWRLGRWGDLRW